MNKNVDSIKMLLSCNNTITCLSDNNYYDETQYTVVDKMPDTFARYVNLKILDIVGLGISELPDEINLLKNLAMLNCDSNDIAHIELCLPALEVFSCFDNKLTEFPTLHTPMLACLHIGKNNITILPYNIIKKMRLCVFLYHDNPVDDLKNNKELINLEYSRQGLLLQYHNDHLFHCFIQFDDIWEKHIKKRINIKQLKNVEEIIFEEYYYNDFICRLMNDDDLFPMKKITT